MSRRVSFLVLPILFAALSASAQKSWEKHFNGYVITRQDSIIRGYLQFKILPDPYNEEIDLLKTPTSKPLVFDYNQINGYVYRKDTFRILHDFYPFDDNKISFDNVEGKVIVTGELSLYKIKYWKRAGLFEKPSYVGGALVEPVPGQPIQKNMYIVSFEDNLYGVTSDNFKTMMPDLVANDQELASEIVKGTLHYKNMEEIVKTYNKQRGMR